jgi:2-iminobutanoate/2-iminopropanoate deaminase
MPRQAISTNDAPAPVAHYSQGCRARGIIAVAGQVGVDPASGAIPADVASQTEQALRNLQAVLAAGGAGLDDVIRVDAYLTDLDDLPHFNTTYARWFKSPPPARTTVFVRLSPGLKVEITALAVVPDGAAAG